ncbi:MAG TPA: VOC family protein [Candidatus Limnocylindrales bacterium]|nr:VOC family protein [Candidatus Limnocylindrales bacterium]
MSRPMNSGNDSRRSRTPGAMAFTELASTNLSETRKFLEDTFGWRFDSVQMPTGQYLTFQNPAGTTVGIRSAQKSEIPGSTNYVLVKDLDEAERKVRKKGGQIVLPRTDIPGMGSFFWFKIPSGPVMACWQDTKEP